MLFRLTSDLSFFTEEISFIFFSFSKHTNLVMILQHLMVNHFNPEISTVCYGMVIQVVRGLVSKWTVVWHWWGVEMKVWLICVKLGNLATERD